ncbi:AMP-binding protein [Rhodococcus opacus]|uniref:AMP-binding protein n=1 Tax=Rhodococcus opacus TaxID=37919 RepID=A0ABT4NP98_RHOOP|nr:AMP-binding protein [Rhodococcus opacus]MCZ4589200.1 AMP-binding protein [Rhodococcus opacus]
MVHSPAPPHPHPHDDRASQRILRQRIASRNDIDALEKQFSPTELRTGATFYDALVAAAAEHPDKSAIVAIETPNFLEPARVLTYRDLIEAIERAASLFHDSAGSSPSVVAVMLPMLPEGLIAIWGAATSGIAVPLNPFLELTALVRIMNDARCTTLVTVRATIEEKCGGNLELLRDAVPTLQSIYFVDAPGTPGDLNTAMDTYAGSGLTFDRDLDPYRDAVLMPTGGTTGTPKLVRMSQFGQLTVTWNVGALMGPRPDGVVAHGMPNFHCGGSVSLGLRTLLYGQTLLTLTSEGYRNRDMVEKFWDIARRYRVTSLLATPTTAQTLLSLPGSSDGHCIEDFHLGGSTVPTELVRAFHDRFGIWLRENWGMTEVHGTVTGHPNAGSEPRIGSVGIPLPFCRVRAVELDHRGRVVRECPPGERGELVIGGPVVSRGYLNQELNDEFFVTGMPDGQVWANTGDLGTVDEDGYVWVSGRAKDLIIRGGHNIDPREIEHALERHPEVHLVAAVGRPDAAKGELPVAFVQLEEGATVEPGELLSFCREHVQERAAIPVEVIVLGQLPLTPVGKLAKPTMRTLATEREVHAQVMAAFPGGVACEIRVDNTGLRPLVIVELEDVAEEIRDRVRALRVKLASYEFDSDVQVGCR